MDENDVLAQRFEGHRDHLRAVAYRMLGSLAEADDADGVDPGQQALLADSVGLALLVVLETLSPPERLAFVLHDMFAVSFEEIGAVLDRSPAVLAPDLSREVRGAPAIAAQAMRFRRFAGASVPALVNGAVGMVALPDGQPQGSRGDRLRRRVRAWRRDRARLGGGRRAGPRRRPGGRPRDGAAEEIGGRAVAVDVTDGPPAASAS
jgi:RNA polymerase sigma-70 factor (ECF subfamily)